MAGMILTSQIISSLAGMWLFKGIAETPAHVLKATTTRPLYSLMAPHLELGAPQGVPERCLITQEFNVDV